MTSADVLPVDAAAGIENGGEGVQVVDLISAWPPNVSCASLAAWYTRARPRKKVPRSLG